MAGVSVLIIHLGQLQIRMNVSKYVDAIPIQHVPRACIRNRECVEEIRWMYTPSALRPGAVGWYPEGGKVWEKYGLPKSV
jgi:hypothetical protein